MIKLDVFKNYFLLVYMCNLVGCGGTEEKIYHKKPLGFILVLDTSGSLRKETEMLPDTSFVSKLVSLSSRIDQSFVTVYNTSFEIQKNIEIYSQKVPPEYKPFDIPETQKIKYIQNRDIIISINKKNKKDFFDKYNQYISEFKPSSGDDFSYINKCIENSVLKRIEFLKDQYNIFLLIISDLENHEKGKIPSLLDSMLVKRLNQCSIQDIALVSFNHNNVAIENLKVAKKLSHHNEFLLLLNNHHQNIVTNE